MITNTLRRLSPLLLVALAGASAAPQAAKPAAAVAPFGDYVEARTASVFCGACHYNGERVTDGRAAVAAFSIAGGSYAGVDLTGVKVMAAVRCDDNLAESAAGRKSEIIVDGDAAKVQAAAAWVESQDKAQLGTIASVRQGKITFRDDAHTYAVSSPEFASLDVQPMPDAACCSQPHLVWYTPLTPIQGRRVGYTASATYDAGRVGDAWQRSDENSAFYGSFGTH